LDSQDFSSYEEEDILTDEDLFPTNNNDSQSNNSLQSSLLVDHSNGHPNSQLNGEFNSESGFEVASEGINTIINDPLLNEQVNNDEMSLYPMNANTGGLPNHQSQLLGDDLFSLLPGPAGIPGIPVAQANPQAAAIAGGNGTAQSAPIGTAIVGTSGVSISIPVSTSLTGKNGLAVSAPSASSQAGVGGIAIAGGQSIAVAGLVSPQEEISQISGAQKKGLLAHLGNLYPSFLQHLQQFNNQNNSEQQEEVEESESEPAAESVGIPKHPNNIVPAGAFDLYSNLHSNLERNTGSQKYNNLKNNIKSQLYSNLKSSIDSQLYRNLQNKHQTQAISIPLVQGSHGGPNYIFPRVINYFVAVQPQQLYSMLNK